MINYPFIANELPTSLQENPGMLDDLMHPGPERARTGRLKAVFLQAFEYGNKHLLADIVYELVILAIALALGIGPDRPLVALNERIQGGFIAPKMPLNQFFIGYHINISLPYRMFQHP